MNITTNHPADSDTRDRKVSVVRRPIGWEVREVEGQHVLRSVIVTDWHRVERVMQAFAHDPQSAAAER